jgi:hypothetical protein
MKSIIKNSAHSTLHVGYEEKYLSETVNKKILDFQTDKHINLKENMIH